MFCQLPFYSKVSQPYVYVYPLLLGFLPIYVMADH